MGILKRLQKLIFSLICLVLLVDYRAYYDLVESSLLLLQISNLDFSVVDLAHTAIDGDTSFSTLFRPDDHAIIVPSIPIDCSRVLLVPTELSAVSRKSTET
jgi:hypothetical protein